MMLGGVDAQPPAVKMAHRKSGKIKGLLYFAMNLMARMV